MICSDETLTWKAIGLIFLVGVWLGLIVLDGATYLLLVLILTCNLQLCAPLCERAQGSSHCGDDAGPDP
jgi:hypothetical protein